MKTSNNRFGPSFEMPAGYIAHVTDEKSSHVFGGQSWKLVGDETLPDSPALIITLGLDDPKLSSLRFNGLHELPLCSLINSTVVMGVQEYTVDYSRSEICLREGSVREIEVISQECQIPNPLPEKSLALIEMAEEDFPTCERRYWEICDSFLGGPAVIRILGAPLWLQEPIDVTCRCPRRMAYIASIGYEPYNGPFELLDDRPFFIGEVALYFFFCKECRTLKVISQDA